jgi:heat shock protein HslJ/uncharacterized membrane protein
MKHLILLFALLLSMACSKNPSRQADPDSTQVITSAIVGNWSGGLTCEDCAYITYQLTLASDQSFNDKTVYHSSTPNVVENSGSWSFDNDSTILLNKKEGNFNKWRVRNDHLLLVDKNGQITEGQNELVKSMPGENLSFWQKKLDKGIIFVAMGNEPSWSLTFYDDDRLVVSHINRSSELTVNNPEKYTTENGWTYSDTNDPELKVMVEKTSCTDQMSGEQFPYQVEVQTNDMDMKGCGKFLADYRLHDIWALEELDTLTRKDLPATRPYIEIHLDDNRLMGNGGCNLINGDIEVRGHEISISPLISTRRYCPDQSIEDLFLRHFSEKTFQYEIENGFLTLFQEDKKVMAFRKID